MESERRCVLCFQHPTAVATGSPIAWDSGNANATVIGDRHYIAFYSGKASDTSVMVSEFTAFPVATDE